MKIIIISNPYDIPKIGVSTVYLAKDQWNDYSFVTNFYLSAHDEHGVLHEIGNVKIGFNGQTTATPTYSKLPNVQTQLPDGFFSVGQDVSYYSNLKTLSPFLCNNILKSLKDIVFKQDLINSAMHEEVFSTSLLRSVSLSVIKGQYARVLEGSSELTNYQFKFIRPESQKVGGLELRFNVKAGKTPSTNIHAIIGRNGVGKTTILNDMIKAITKKGIYDSKFYEVKNFSTEPISADYFSSLVSVSFSAFDPFTPPTEQPDPSLGACYFYIGLKQEDDSLKELSHIHDEFIGALKTCLYDNYKRLRWLKAIERLESDENFASMQLNELFNSPNNELENNALKKIKRMSSGHAVVLLTITRLVSRVEEKTLVLIDEPESHLHPPLLSAFIRALSELLLDRNGVAIIATHSPVVLQEIPKSCVWKVNRYGLISKTKRPDIETFGENVGILTREVFGLEVVKSGFHDLLVRSVEEGGSYEQIISQYNNQLGLEARSLLKTLVFHRDQANIS